MCIPMDKCCYCVSLRTGTQIISILSTVMSILITVIYGAASVLPRLPHSKSMVYMVMAGLAASHSFSGILLIWGTFLKRARCMWPWILVSWLWSVLLVSASIAGTALLLYSGTLSIDDEENIMISAYFIFGCFLFYITSIVNSRRKEILRYTEVPAWNPPNNAWSYTRPYSNSYYA